MSTLSSPEPVITEERDFSRSHVLYLLVQRKNSGAAQGWTSIAELMQDTHMGQQEVIAELRALFQRFKLEFIPGSGTRNNRYRIGADAKIDFEIEQPAVFRARPKPRPVEPVAAVRMPTTARPAVATAAPIVTAPVIALERAPLPAPVPTSAPAVAAVISDTQVAPQETPAQQPATSALQTPSHPLPDTGRESDHEDQSDSDIELESASLLDRPAQRGPSGRFLSNRTGGPEPEIAPAQIPVLEAKPLATPSEAVILINLKRRPGSNRVTISLEDAVRIGQQAVAARMGNVAQAGIVVDAASYDRSGSSKKKKKRSGRGKKR